MIEVNGADQFVALAKALKDAGDKTLQAELSKGIREAVAPVREAVARSAEAKLPRRGGLNQRVANARVTTRQAKSGRGQGVRLQAGGPRSQLDRINKGQVRHPVFGNKQTGWVVERVQPGYWDEPTSKLGPQATVKVQAALDRVAAKIERAT